MTIREVGFTLIELLFTLALMSVLIILSQSGFGVLLQKQQAQNAASSFIANLAFARSEAIKRNQPVSLCPSGPTKHCGDDWSKGYKIFILKNMLNNQDEILRVTTLQNELRILSTNPHKITFGPDGRCFTRTTLYINTQALKQKIVIYDSGRVRLETLS